MDNNNFKINNIRIVDIAKRANVSTGTVDRVIHKRGRVSKDKVEKVEKAIADLQYKPNVAAQYLSLKKNKTVVIYAIIPLYEKGEYWEIAASGLMRAAHEVNNFGVIIKILQFDQYDVVSFVKLINEIKLLKDIDGVVIAPLFKNETETLASMLYGRNIPYVYINSNNIDNNSFLAYFGIHSFDSGKIIAKLMTAILPEQKDVLKVRFRISNTQAIFSQTELVDAGFKSYINEQINRPLFIHHLDIYVDKDDIDKTLDKFFNKNKNIGGIVVYNSRAHYIADYLERREMHNTKIIGFDLLDNNVKFLKKGYIDFLISQQPELQCYYAITALVKHLVLGETIKKINYIPIDVLVKENVDYYYYWNNHFPN